MGGGVSQRRACRLLSVARSALGYESRVASRDAPVLAAMRELARQYPRYGYRRIQVLLARRGLEMSADRAYRLWRQAQLQVPRRRPRRRIASGRPRPTPPSAAHHVWAYDFVYDRCASGQQLKCLTVVEEWTRECLAIEVSGSIRSRQVIDVLSRLLSIHGAPGYLRSDNGPEFVSRAILKWLADANIETAHIDPGKPWQNATNQATFEGDQAAVKGSPHSLAPNGWKIEGKQPIVGHGGCGAFVAREERRFDNEFLRHGNRLNHARHPYFWTGMNNPG